MVELLLLTTSNATTLEATSKRCIYWMHHRGIVTVDDMTRYILFFPLAIVAGVVGLLGNSLAYIVIGLERPFTSTSMLLRALALADNLSLVAFIFLRTPVTIVDSTAGNFDFYLEFFHLSFGYLWTIRWLCKTISIYMTVVVAVERYIAVCKPFKAASICTLRNARIAVALVVLLSLACQFPQFFYITYKYTYDPCTDRKRPYLTYNTELMRNPIYMIGYIYVFDMILMSIFPTCALTFLAYALISTLRQAAQNSLSSGDGPSRSDNTKPITIRVIGIVLIFIILETPGGLVQIVLMLYHFLEVLGYIDISILYSVQSASYFLSVLNNVANFYVYCLTGRRFRKSFKRIFSVQKLRQLMIGQKKY
ncbi:FMRFamide receptor-like [Lineus longissimus]|uniref:FMRFamide receptor-like n=1 Tax=Lineus longissimus TaxID=88925 RepID=UPI002B4C66DC